MKNIVAVIPSRYQSSRFPGKPLAIIAGKPMIQRVYEQVKKAQSVSRVIVATDDERIYNAVDEFHGEVVMTGTCRCGTDRVFEAIKNYPCDVVINVQGDEPLIKPEMIDELISAFEGNNVAVATLCKEINSSIDINNPNIVKVIRDKDNNAVYFSRYAIPYIRDKQQDVKYFKHIGIYGYRKDFLKTYIGLSPMPLEKAESLEQLRILEHGYKIQVIETCYDSIGVDNPEDITRIEEILKSKTTVT